MWSVPTNFSRGMYLRLSSGVRMQLSTGVYIQLSNGVCMQFSEVVCLKPSEVVWACNCFNWCVYLQLSQVVCVPTALSRGVSVCSFLKCCVPAVKA